jgi:hypothetical protein
MPIDKPLNVFISYSNNDTDRSQLDKLVKEMAMLKETYNLDIWFDSRIKIGKEWDKQIQEKLESADIFILLLSRDFLASEYIKYVELPKIFERTKKNECFVSPILLSSCRWKDDKRINAATVIPKKQSTLLEIKEWKNEDAAFLEVSNKLEELILDIKSGCFGSKEANQVETSVIDLKLFWKSFFTQKPPKNRDTLDLSMFVDINRDKCFGKELVPHFEKHINKKENLVYLISACPTQKPSSIAKRLVYSFQDEHLSDFFRRSDPNNDSLNDKLKKEMDVINLSISPSYSQTWRSFWTSFCDCFLKEKIEYEQFRDNPANWLDGHKRIALAFRIDENDWGGAIVHEQLTKIIDNFDALPNRYRKFIFFFICRFPDLHLHRSEDCQCHLIDLDSIVGLSHVLHDDIHKKHIKSLTPVPELDVKKWAFKYLDNDNAHSLLKELRNKHSTSQNSQETVYYNMEILEEMQYEAYVHLRDAKNS